MNIKKTSNRARHLCELGARPLDDWTRYTILREVKRCLPECFEQAKSMPLEVLYNSISPIVEATTHGVYCTQYAYSFESVASGCRRNHYRFLPCFFLEACMKRPDLAAQWRRDHKGRQFEPLHGCR